MNSRIIIDHLLYRVLPEWLHRWGAENKARARALVVAAVLTFGPIIVSAMPAEYQTEALAAGGAVIALIQGEATHRVVEPWDGEDA